MGTAMTIPLGTSMLTSAYTTPLSQGVWLWQRKCFILACYMALGALGCPHDYLLSINYIRFLDSRAKSRTTLDNDKRKTDFPGVFMLQVIIVLKTARMTEWRELQAQSFFLSRRHPLLAGELQNPSSLWQSHYWDFCFSFRLHLARRLNGSEQMTNFL